MIVLEDNHKERLVDLSSCQDFHPAAFHQLAWRTNLSL